MIRKIFYAALFAAVCFISTSCQEMIDSIVPVERKNMTVSRSASSNEIPAFIYNTDTCTFNLDLVSSDGRTLEADADNVKLEVTTDKNYLDVTTDGLEVTITPVKPSNGEKIPVSIKATAAAHNAGSYSFQIEVQDLGKYLEVGEGDDREVYKFGDPVLVQHFTENSGFTVLNGATKVDHAVQLQAIGNTADSGSNSTIDILHPTVAFNYVEVGFRRKAASEACSIFLQNSGMTGDVNHCMVRFSANCSVKNGFMVLGLQSTGWWQDGPDYGSVSPTKVYGSKTPDVFGVMLTPKDDNTAILHFNGNAQKLENDVLKNRYWKDANQQAPYIRIKVNAGNHTQGAGEVQIDYVAFYNITKK